MKIDPQCKKFLKHVGAKVRSLRLSRGWTLEQTEDHGWPNWRHLQQVESGKNITLATVWNLSRLLKVDPSDILSE